jgi:hypothetical protein
MEKQTKTYQGRALVYLVLAIFLILHVVSITRGLLVNNFFTSDSFTRADFLWFHLGAFILVGILYCLHTIFTVFSLEDSIKFKLMKIVYNWRTWNLGVLSGLLLVISFINYGIYSLFEIKFHSFISIAVVIGLYILTLSFTHPRMRNFIEKQKLKNKKPES